MREDSARERWAERVTAMCLLAAMAGGAGFVVAYWADWGTPLLGGALGGGLLAVGVGLVVWGRHLLPPSEEVDEHEPQLADPEAFDDVTEAIDPHGALARRTLLRRLVLGAGGALGLAAIVPLRSLGPRPDDAALGDTAWEPGSLVVDTDGEPVDAAAVDVDSALTVFPDGHVDDYNSQAVLVRLPEGFVAFSQICTHAGCPVALYQSDEEKLFCPCHQSAFDVRDGARPVAGPAARALPELAVEVDGEGVLRATIGFTRPVGPGWWRRS
jgi:ubiquinol-cytochrome c reductase iron-sulfur subunit